MQSLIPSAKSKRKETISSRNNSPRRRCPCFWNQKIAADSGDDFLRFDLNCNEKSIAHCGFCPLKTSVHLRPNFKCCRNKAGDSLFCTRSVASSFQMPQMPLAGRKKQAAVPRHASRLFGFPGSAVLRCFPDISVEPAHAHLAAAQNILRPIRKYHAQTVILRQPDGTRRFLRRPAIG